MTRLSPYAALEESESDSKDQRKYYANKKGTRRIIKLGMRVTTRSPFFTLRNIRPPLALRDIPHARASARAGVGRQ